MRVIYSRRQSAMEKHEAIAAELRKHADFRTCENNLKKAEIDVAIYGKEEQQETVDKYRCMRAQLLEKYGYTEKDLQPHYHCEICGDTGYVGSETCVCLREEIRKQILQEGNVERNERTFENSAETNKHNLAVYKKAAEICEKNTLRNMLLLGKNGTGKTYLLSACANLCAKLGKSVVFQTAYNLNSLFLECRLGDISTGKTIMDNLVDVDVLIIDDLGTEVVYNNVTAPYLFALLNERITSAKQTFISSNLSLRQIENRYDSRIFSRLLDKTISFVAQLEGTDKRIDT